MFELSLVMALVLLMSIGGDKHLPSVSHAVVRGRPNAGQLYLDTILDAIIENDRSGPKRNRTDVNLAEVIYHGMSTRLDSICMINGLTGVKFTNADILKLAIPISHAFLRKNLRGQTIMLVLSNTENLFSIYYGALFAGVVLFLLDPNSTKYELSYFIPLVEPALVVCDGCRSDDVTEAVCGEGRDTLVITDEELVALAADQAKGSDEFEVSDAAPASQAVLLPTSGSTGMPKAAILTHEGLLRQAPSLWSYHDRFPRPTDTALLLSTAQWMTHTNLLTTCPIFDITMLTSSKRDVEHILYLCETFQPSWALLSPAAVSALAAPAQREQLRTLRTILVTGAPPNPQAMEQVREKLSPTAWLCNSYGMTEAQGFTAIPDSTTPKNSIGRTFNNFLYKLIGKDGKEVAVGKQGELCLKGASVIKGYLKNEAAYQECMTEDGWLRTGDLFRVDENEQLYFVERMKFSFKHLNYQISPEELERLISSVSGVGDCVVGGSERGATAAVVRSGEVERADIHRALESLSDYKHLHGGIAWVAAIPRTHSGKLHRADCNKMLRELIESGQCF